MALLLLALGYLLGSFPTGYVLTRLLRGQDLRAVGSGGTGATNTRRALGTKWGIVVLVVDLAKGVLAVVIAQSADASPLLLALVGMAAVVGHCWPVWLGFRGGKGVATACGAALALTPWLLLLVPVFVLIVVLWRYVSLGSIIAVALAPLLLLLLAAADLTPWGYLFFGVPVALMIVYRHRENIARLRMGTESKLRAQPSV